MNNAVHTTTLTQMMTLEFVDEAGEVTPLAAEFTYNPLDPFAVSILFHSDPSPVRWTFSRDLLIEGLYEPSGDGDVHVWPCLSPNGTAIVVLDLCSPGGEVMLQIQTRDLHEFINQMTSRVPLGAESEYFDVDAALKTLLA